MAADQLGAQALFLKFNSRLSMGYIVANHSYCCHFGKQDRILWGLIMVRATKKQLASG